MLSRVWRHVKLSDVSLRTRPRYSLGVDEDVKKSNKQSRQRIKSKVSYTRSPRMLDLKSRYRLKRRPRFLLGPALEG